jgi:small subunit ribosomal protein S17
VRKVRIGTVLRDARNKTIVVQVERRVSHPMYGKQMRLHTRFHAHDEANEARAGDRVRIAETRPLSRLKRWRLVAILKPGATAAP